MPKAFGSDRLEELPEGGYRLHCRVTKGWVARTPKTLVHSEFPGTTVLWEEKYYEVASAIESETGVTYDLTPWNDDHVMRTWEAYSAEAERERARQRELARTREAKRKTFTALALLTGNLPAHVQIELQNEYGIAAGRITLIAVIPLFLYGAFSIVWLNVVRFAGAQASAMIPIPKWLLYLGAYLFIESGIRFALAMSSSQPIGSFPVVFAYSFYEFFSGKSRATKPKLTLEVSDQQLLSDRYDLLRPILAFLTPAEQRMLQQRFGFDPFRGGKYTAIVLLVVFVVQAYLSLKDVGTITGGMTDFVLLMLSGYFIAEQIIRLRRLAEGQPAGSVLGVFVRPFSRRLFA